MYAGLGQKRLVVSFLFAARMYGRNHKLQSRRIKSLRGNNPKKKQSVMDAEKQVFIYGNKEAFESGKDKAYAPGCIANGIPEKIAQEIWAQMKDFAKYAFNRSHAACYAYIACITAYMSCHWPSEFYAALLNAFIENSDKVKAYLSQASHRNIQLLLPHINLSDCSFSAEGGNIRFGLQGISGLKSAATSIVEERERGGVFTDAQDLYDRMADCGGKLNKKSVEGLVFGGALECFSDNKAALLELFSLLEVNYKSQEAQRQLGQLSMFSEAESRVALPNTPRMDERAELEREGETLGMFLSRHPADAAVAQTKDLPGYFSVESLLTAGPHRGVFVVGMVRALRQFYTKNKEPMCSFSLETRYASIPCVVFPKQYRNCIGDLYENRVVAIHGDLSLDNHNEGNQLQVISMQSEDSLMEALTPYKVLVQSRAEQDRVLSYIRQHPGVTPVVLCAGGKEYPLTERVCRSASAFEYLSGGYRDAQK